MSSTMAKSKLSHFLLTLALVLCCSALAPPLSQRRNKATKQYALVADAQGMHAEASRDRPLLLADSRVVQNSSLHGRIATPRQSAAHVASDG